MSVTDRIKNNLFRLVLVVAYGVLFALSPQMGLGALKSSGYFIKEMLMIMPIIFVLTALLDLWVPREKIVAYMGKGSGAKGVFLSFALGSISAGPIYAAFPMCIMLHKKGASIRNLVIILSSWAVIKIPMLINEAKFLGPKFMLVRWVLSIISILIFSWLTGKIVKDEDLPQGVLDQAGLHLDQGACMGCGICTRTYPQAFEMAGKKARAKKIQNLDRDRVQEAMEACPVQAIHYREEEKK
ncbi:MAG: permease [Tissierellia bacterium]|nr:permease [Tissierellia bacterium]